MISKTFVLVGENEEQPFTKRRSVSTKTAAVIGSIVVLVLAFFAGFGLHYLVNRDGTSMPASGGMLKHSGANNAYSKCNTKATLGSVSLAGPSKNIAGTLSTTGVLDHVNFASGTTGFPFASNTKTSFACVDARATDPILGTPGNFNV